MLIPISLLLIGLAFLIVSGDALVKGASSIAKRLGVKPIVIGLTIVAFGTSAPELIVNIFSALQGSTDLAIGNVVGSNIANILLILGVAAIIYPLRVQSGTVWKEIPLALFAAVILFVMGNDLLIDNKPFNEMTRSDGLTLIGFFIIFLYYTFGIAKNGNGPDVEKEGDFKPQSWGISTLLTLGGIAGLFFGGKLLVDNAIILARIAGLSEALIGLTIVAVGTSLPELVTSVVAAYRKQDDIAVGNVVGSNIFNILWILGITSVITPLPFSTALNFDLFFNVLATFLLFIFMFVGTRQRVNRWQGAIFLSTYIVYIIFAISRG